MFERLYSEEINEQIDNLAEKITTYDANILGSMLMLDAFNGFLKPSSGRVMEGNDFFHSVKTKGY